jgi:hypothetical protein
MSDTPETDAEWEELCSNFSRYRIAEKMKTYCQEKERERDEARRERDAWEKVAILNAEKLGCLLFGKVEVAE